MNVIAHLFFWLIFDMDSSYGWEWWDTLLFLHICFTSPNHFFVLLSALSLLGSQGGVHIWAKVECTPEWVASSLRDPMWAIDGAVPCSTVPRQCSKGYSGSFSYYQNMFHVCLFWGSNGEPTSSQPCSQQTELSQPQSFLWLWFMFLCLWISPYTWHNLYIFRIDRKQVAVRYMNIQV